MSFQPGYNRTPAEFYAYEGTKTRRREYRMKVRHAIGSSSEDAPTLSTALDAAHSLGELIKLASSGRFEIRVHDRHTGTARRVPEAQSLLRYAQGQNLHYIPDQLP